MRAPSGNVLAGITVLASTTSCVWLILPLITEYTATGAIPSEATSLTLEAFCELFHVGVLTGLTHVALHLVRPVPKLAHRAFLARVQRIICVFPDRAVLTVDLVDFVLHATLRAVIARRRCGEIDGLASLAFQALRSQVYGRVVPNCAVGTGGLCCSCVDTASNALLARCALVYSRICACLTVVAGIWCISNSVGLICDIWHAC